MKNLLAVTLVALVFGACSVTPVAEAVVQPTPQIIYVTPAPTTAPTPEPTPRPTPRPTPEADTRATDFIEHIMVQGPVGADLLIDISDAIEAYDWADLTVAVQNLLDWSLKEGVYTTSVSVPACAQPLVDNWYTIISNYGASALALQAFMDSGNDSELAAATELMGIANGAVENLDFGVCGGISGTSFSS